MFLTDLLIKISLSNNNTFIWDTKLKKLRNIQNIKFLDIDLLVGIERQKKILLSNTINFAKGNFTNNALLWGSRGNGKSSLIKSVFYQVSKKVQNLKLRVKYLVEGQGYAKYKVDDAYVARLIVI